VVFGSRAEAVSPSLSVSEAKRPHFFRCQSSPCTVTTVFLPTSRGTKYLAQRPELAAEMGSAGRRLVQTYHSPHNHYEDLIALYEQLMLPSRASAASPGKRPPIRVAFIGGRGVISKYSGIETYYEEVGKRLAETGYEVTVYCRTYFTPDVDAYNGMRLVRLPTLRTKHLETLVHTLFSTIHVIFKRCDIVHYHALGPALFSAKSESEEGQ
jgi:hypothetical protein